MLFHPAPGNLGHVPDPVIMRSNNNVDQDIQLPMSVESCANRFLNLLRFRDIGQATRAHTALIFDFALKSISFRIGALYQDNLGTLSRKHH